MAVPRSAPTRLFSRLLESTTHQRPFSSSSRAHALPPTLPLRTNPSALAPKPFPSSSPTPLELIASQPSHYITILLMGRRYTLTPNDVLTIPKLKNVSAGQRISLTRILEVGSRDYTLRAGPTTLTPPTSAVSAKMNANKEPLLRPVMARSIVREGGVPRDWQRHPDSLPYLKHGEVKAELTVLEHVKGEMFQVEKFKRRKGYRRTLRSKLEFTKLRLGEIIIGLGAGSSSKVVDGQAQ